MRLTALSLVLIAAGATTAHAADNALVIPSFTEET
jgi:hypothetical protein